MEGLFEALRELIRTPLRLDHGVKTDRSVLLVYPPDRELDFRAHLLDVFVPSLDAGGIPYRLLDLTGALFAGLSADDVEALRDGELDDYRWMRQGLAQRAEASLQARLTSEAARIAGGNLLVYATAALYPVVRYGEVLRALRDVEARIILAFPGEERGGKLHFMNHADGANYLALKLFAR